MTKHRDICAAMTDKATGIKDQVDALRKEMDDCLIPTNIAKRAKELSNLSDKLEKVFESAGKVHKGGVWSTDALFRETKEIVNSYISKGAIAVDMVTSPFVSRVSV